MVVLLLEINILPQLVSESAGQSQLVAVYEKELSSMTHADLEQRL